MSSNKKALGEIKSCIKGGGKPKEIIELDLTGIKIGKVTVDIKKAIEECENL